MESKVRDLRKLVAKAGERIGRGLDKESMRRAKERLVRRIDLAL